jgi:mono/diheme cytochrome c family protein
MSAALRRLACRMVAPAAVALVLAAAPTRGLRAAEAPADAVARGAYLTRAGNCVSCHTTDRLLAGGGALATSFGTFYPPNLTPDPDTGLGAWSADDFWNALHDGRSRDGHALYPAFPYPNYTRVTRADSDAMYAYLRSVPPVKRANRPHQLAFPYNLRGLLPAWRLLFFSPGEFRPVAGRSAEWNRGAYLVNGLGHCNACHGARNFLGASRVDDPFAGSLMPLGTWYAPPLAFDRGPALSDADRADLADLMRRGVSSRGAVYGPMAAVVRDSLQYLTDADLRAMVAYLESPTDHPGRRWEPARDPYTAGRRLYAKQCESCHGALGDGAAPVYPALAANARVTSPVALNAIRMVLVGGFPPATATNPRPYGMPPFGHALNDDEVAAVVTYIRQSWGNRAGAVTAAEVSRTRGIPGE